MYIVIAKVFLKSLFFSVQEGQVVAAGVAAAVYEEDVSDNQ